MKSPFFAILLTILIPSLDDSFVVVARNWGTLCGSSDSYQIVLRNRSAQTRDIKLCLEKTNGKWDCGVQFDVKPGGGEDFEGWYTCHGTGHSRWWTRVSGSDVKFPPDPEPGS